MQAWDVPSDDHTKRTHHLIVHSAVSMLALERWMVSQTSELSSSVSSQCMQCGCYTEQRGEEGREIFGIVSSSRSWSRPLLLLLLL